MTRSSPSELHASLFKHCRRCGWQPRYIGQPGSKHELFEILKEVIACREVGAHQLSGELIDLVEAQGWSSPWLEDNRAWLLLANGQVQEAREIWERLLSSEDPTMPPHARNNLDALDEIPEAEYQIDKLVRLRAHDQPSAWDRLGCEILLDGGDPFNGTLHEELNEAVLTRQPKPEAPWDHQLLLHDQLLDFFEDAIEHLEDQIV